MICEWCSRRHRGRGPEHCMQGAVIVCGGRDFDNRFFVWHSLNRVEKRVVITAIIHGACPTGADAHADAWAKEKMIPVIDYPANWIYYGRRAGPKRNTEMSKHMPKPVLCVAFPGGNGTFDMKTKAEREGILVWTPSA